MPSVLQLFMPYCNGIALRSWLALNSWLLFDPSPTVSIYYPLGGNSYYSKRYKNTTQTIWNLKRSETHQWITQHQNWNDSACAPVQYSAVQYNTWRLWTTSGIYNEAILYLRPEGRTAILERSAPLSHRVEVRERRTLRKTERRTISTFCGFFYFISSCASRNSSLPFSPLSSSRLHRHDKANRSSVIEPLVGHSRFPDVSSKRKEWKTWPRSTSTRTHAHAPVLNWPCACFPLAQRTWNEMLRKMFLADDLAPKYAFPATLSPSFIWLS